MVPKELRQAVLTQVDDQTEITYLDKATLRTLIENATGKFQLQFLQSLIKSYPYLCRDTSFNSGHFSNLKEALDLHNFDAIHPYHSSLLYGLVLPESNTSFSPYQFFSTEPDAKKIERGYQLRQSMSKKGMHEVVFLNWDEINQVFETIAGRGYYWAYLHFVNVFNITNDYTEGELDGTSLTLFKEQVVTRLEKNDIRKTNQILKSLGLKIEHPQNSKHLFLSRID